jgi:hypothetical protein
MIALFKSGDNNLWLSMRKMATVVEKRLVCTIRLRRGVKENYTAELTNTRTSSLSHFHPPHVSLLRLSSSSRYINHSSVEGSPNLLPETQMRSSLIKTPSQHTIGNHSLTCGLMSEVILKLGLDIVVGDRGFEVGSDHVRRAG